MPDVGLDFGSKVQSRTRSLDPSWCLLIDWSPSSCSTLQTSTQAQTKWWKFPGPQILPKHWERFAQIWGHIEASWWRARPRIEGIWPGRRTGRGNWSIKAATDAESGRGGQVPRRVWGRYPETRSRISQWTDQLQEVDMFGVWTSCTICYLAPGYLALKCLLAIYCVALKPISCPEWALTCTSGDVLSYITELRLPQHLWSRLFNSI